MRTTQVKEEKFPLKRGKKYLTFLCFENEKEMPFSTSDNINYPKQKRNLKFALVIHLKDVNNGAKIVIFLVTQNNLKKQIRRSRGIFF
jgi:hypothetical protein